MEKKITELPSRELGTAGVLDSKTSETSYFESQMHFGDSVESLADSDLEDSELQKILTSPLYSQKASEKPNKNGYAGEREREVSEQYTQALRSHFGSSRRPTHWLEFPFDIPPSQGLPLLRRPASFVC